MKKLLPLLFFFFLLNVSAQTNTGNVNISGSYLNSSKDTMLLIEIYGKGLSGEFEYSKLNRKNAKLSSQFGTWVLKDKTITLTVKNSATPLPDLLFQGYLLVDVQDKKNVYYRVK